MMEEFSYDHDFNTHFATDLDYLQHDQQQQQQQHDQQHNQQQQPQPQPIQTQNLEHDHDQHTNDMSASSNASDSGPQRPKRTRAKGEALDVLKRKFEINPTPSLVERKKISDLIGMPEKTSEFGFRTEELNCGKSSMEVIRTQSPRHNPVILPTITNVGVQTTIWSLQQVLHPYFTMKT